LGGLTEFLRDRKAKDTIEGLENAVKVLGLVTSDNYWEATKGNAGYALNVLLSWAKQYPEAEWMVFP
jgi:alanyl-tRNA synthetase